MTNLIKNKLRQANGFTGTIVVDRTIPFDVFSIWILVLSLPCETNFERSLVLRIKKIIAWALAACH